MYSAAFIVRFGKYDEEFQKLTDLIQAAAEASEGYMGKEMWQSMDGDIFNTTYYWRDEKSLNSFSTHPKHIEAKKQYANWYNGYHVIVSKIERSYGDNAIAHITPNERAANV